MDDFVRRSPQRSTPRPKAQTAQEQQKQPKTREEFKVRFRFITKPTIMLAIGVAIVVMVFGAWMLWGHQTNTGVPTDLLTASQASAYPLFYPEPLPSGYSYVSGSYNVADSVTMFNIKDGQGRVFIVTEQAKPSVIEEVAKTKQFSAPAGNAYVADLNGRSVGFVNAGRTLVIISSSGDINGDQLSPLLSSLRRL